MTLTKIRQLRQALLDNAAGGQLHTVHRNDLFALLDDLERMSPEVAYAEKPKVEKPDDSGQ